MDESQAPPPRQAQEDSRVPQDDRRPEASSRPRTTMTRGHLAAMETTSTRRGGGVVAVQGGGEIKWLCVVDVTNWEEEGGERARETARGGAPAPRTW